MFSLFARQIYAYYDDLISYNHRFVGCLYQAPVTADANVKLYTHKRYRHMLEGRGKHNLSKALTS